MTKFMKFEVIAYYVLKVFGYLCGICGMLACIGYAGSLELGTITAVKFVVYELHAIGLMCLSGALYVAREMIVEDFNARERLLRRRIKYQAARTRANYNR